jgi:3-oxoacyl-(acyl-carrier-protein) synthase III
VVGPVISGTVPGRVSVGILGTGVYLPGLPVSNAVVAKSAGADESWIRDRIGIRSRHYAAPTERTSDLAVEAGRRAIGSGGVRPDALLLATVTPDRPVPATASLVQAALGLRGSPAIDVNVACSGFVHAVVLAVGMVASGVAVSPLVIGADTFSRCVDPTDRRTAPLFGDAAGAVQLGAVPEGFGFLSAELWADGTQSEVAVVPPRGEGWFRMDGRAVSDVVLEAGPKLLAAAVAKAGLRLEDLARLVVHQANPRLVVELRDRLGLADPVVPVPGTLTGNTASASVAVALALSHAEHAITRGDVVALLAVGAGMTAGAVVLRWY